MLHRRRVAMLARFAPAAMLMATLPGCGPATTSREGDADIVPASVRSFPITTLATGELEAKNQVELRSQVEGMTTIIEIAPEGSRVKAGDVLVRLSSDEIQTEIEEETLQVTEARLNLEAATSEYEIQESDNAANLRKAELKVQLAELALEQWKQGDSAKKNLELKAAIDRTTRDLDRLTEKWKKSQELYQERIDAGLVPFISYDEYKSDEIALKQAQAAFDTAKLDLSVYNDFQSKQELAQKESDLEEAQQELVRVEKSNDSNLRSKASQRENRAILLANREERLSKYQAQLAACTITAPRDGLVVYATSLERESWRMQSEGPLAVGRQIGQNDLLIVLPDTSDMVAAVKVHESLAGRIKPGQRAEVKVEAAGGTVVPGTVASIGILAESGGWRDPNRREYTVRISLEPGEHSDALKPSMRCEAKLFLGDVTDVLSVPVQAVFSEGPVRFVYVDDGGRLQRRPVSLGRRSDLYAEIRAGLSADDSVLLRAPLPGETSESTPWDEAQLTAAGYALDDNGRPVLAGGGRGPGGPPARGGVTPTATPGSTTEVAAPASDASAAPATAPAETSTTTTLAAPTVDTPASTAPAATTDAVKDAGNN